MAEVVAAVIGAIVAEPCRYVFGYVQASIKNFFKRKSNFNALKNDMCSLMNLKDEVQQKLALKDQSEDVPRSQVEGWATKVDDLKRRVDVLLSTKSTSDGNNLQDSCCPFPLQCKLSNKLARKIEEVEQLMQAGNEALVKMVDVSDKTKPVEYRPGPSIIGQKTASESLARVLDLLSRDDVSRIGVWGMGGIGKTTLVRNLNNELEKAPSAQAFSVIIWVTVSKEKNLRIMQKQIAKRLNLKVDEETNDENMAIQLHDRLRKERRFLLILDDVWEDIDLDLLGIPRQELCPSSKIIITSRSFRACKMMKTHTLQVNPLNDEEAWKLFREHAGEVVMDEHIRPEAEKVCKECDGLPLAIAVVGASMRGESMIELWKDRLRALQVPPIEIEKDIKEKVFLILKRSYDWLENKQTKFCFLFCCLYPEDYEIEVNELVRYWFCEGLLDGLRNYEEITNRGISIIHKLRECCLLEPCRSEHSVKMHDVVRDVGIWIAESFENECKSLVQSRIGLTCISENHESFSSYKRLSFMINRISSLPACVVQCEEVKTLLLQGNVVLDALPASFLEGFRALKILDLRGSGITSLPSLSHLHELRALVLSGCLFLTKLPPLDGLSRLLVLDCSFTGLKNVPQSLEKLSNLRQLDLSDAQRLETIPYSALSKLSNLESLNLLHAGRIESQGLSEALPLLKQLSVVYASLDSIPHLTSNIVNWFERIKEFKIVIGNVEGYLISRDAKNAMSLRNVCLSQESIGWLLCNVNYLEFDGCEGLTQMFDKLITDHVSLASLKTLCISESDLIFVGGVASFDLLPNLEEIYLRKLSKLESVSDLSRLLGLRFSRLKRIVIDNCSKFKCVISLEENQTLEKLDMIVISDCEMLESLFKYPRTPHVNLNLTAPNLQQVMLQKLPKLESPWRKDESWKDLRSLKLLHCHKIRKLHFTAQNAKSIKVIIHGDSDWWNGLEWDNENTKMLLEIRFREEILGDSDWWNRLEWDDENIKMFRRNRFRA